MKSSPKNRLFLPARIIVLLGLFVTVSALLFIPQVATAVAVISEQGDSPHDPLQQALHEKPKG